MNKKQQKEMERGKWAETLWNQAHPPGTRVCLTDDAGKPHMTKTTSMAWCLGHGDPVVKVEGRSGGYLLYRIEAVGAAAS